MQRVGGLPSLQRHHVPGALWVADGQIGAVDELCVRLISTRFTQLELVGVKCMWNLRRLG